MTLPGTGTREAPDPMNTTCPCARRRSGSVRRVSSAGAITLVSNCSCQRSRVASSALQWPPTAATWTRPSSRSRPSTIAGEVGDDQPSHPSGRAGDEDDWPLCHGGSYRYTVAANGSNPASTGGTGATVLLTSTWVPLATDSSADSRISSTW